MGPPNAEGLGGHALWGSGLEFRRAPEVNNSPWVAELMRMEATDELVNQNRNALMEGDVSPPVGSPGLHELERDNTPNEPGKRPPTRLLFQDMPEGK